MSPLIGTIIAGLEPADAGAGSGIVTTTLQAGLVLGVALGSLVFFTVLGRGHTGASYANAFAIVMPGVAALLIVAAVLVHRLPITPFEAQNALIERLPGWASGYAYSMFLMTGGRVGQGLFDEVLSRVADRRLRRIEDAPQPPGDYWRFISTRPARTARGSHTWPAKVSRTAPKRFRMKRNACRSSAHRRDS